MGELWGLISGVGGGRGALSGSWWLEVAMEVLSKVLPALPCQHPQQMPVLPGIIGMTIPLSTFGIPYGTVYGRE